MNTLPEPVVTHKENSSSNRENKTLLSNQALLISGIALTSIGISVAIVTLTLNLNNCSGSILGFMCEPLQVGEALLVSGIGLGFATGYTASCMVNNVKLVAIEL